MYCTMDNAGPDEAILNIVGCCDFIEAKRREVCTVVLDKGLFLKTEGCFKKTLHLALE